MKLILAGLLAVALAATVSAAVFEGRVTLKMHDSSSGDKDMVFTIATKGQLIRMEMTNPQPMTVISDPGAHKMIMLMPQKKLYMVMPLPAASPAAKTGEPPKLERTGKIRDILGYPCTQYLAKDEQGHSVEIWATDKLGGFGGFAAEADGNSPTAWTKLFHDQAGLYPLLMVIHGQGDGVTQSMEVVKIEPGALPDSQFRPPTDYQEMSMGGMGGMMPPNRH